MSRATSTPMFVREIMTRRIGTVDTNATVEDMRQIAHCDDLLAVAVVNQRQPIAVLTRRNLDNAATATREPDNKPWFEQLGGQPPIVLAPDDLTAELETVFYQSGTTVALVVDHHDVVGIVTLDQLTDEATSPVTGQDLGQVFGQRPARPDHQPHPADPGHQTGHDHPATPYRRPRTPAA